MCKSIYNAFSLAGAPCLVVFIKSEVLFLSLLYYILCILMLFLPASVKLVSETVISMKMKTSLLSCPTNKM